MAPRLPVDYFQVLFISTFKTAAIKSSRNGAGEHFKSLESQREGPASLDTFDER